jgi:hypothetical protein
VRTVTGVTDRGGVSRPKSRRKGTVTVIRPGSRGATTVKFRLDHAGPLVYTLEELAPVCRTLATFHGRGERGVNKVRFQARIGTRPVAPGTYRLVARRPGGAVVMAKTLVVVRRARPTAEELRRASRADTCGSGTQVVAEGGSLGKGGAPAGSGKKTHARRAARTAAPAERPHGDRGGVLGVTKSLSPTPRKLPFLVLALVGLAILLLALGALPRSVVPVAAAGALVARRRLELATAGIATLVASVIAYLIA